jgi:hypothetical protein
MTDLFMLTKPPGSARAKLCLELVKRSRDPVLYLFCDGVFHLVGKQELPKARIVICRDDALTRGVPIEDDSTCSQDEFYERMVHDMMEDADRVYTF